MIKWLNEKQYLYKTNKIYYIMYHGTMLQLALLRKISKLSTSPNYRQKFNDYKRKKTIDIEPFETSKLYESKISYLPLVEINLNKEKNKSAPTKKSKPRNTFFREQNITISGWSIKGGQDNDIVKQTRYLNQENTDIDVKENTFVPRKRHYSDANHIQTEKKFAIYNQNQIKLAKIKRKQKKQKLLKEKAWRQKNSILKHINLNYEHQVNAENIKRRQPKQQKQYQSQSKLMSYDAFVAEMKFQQKHKKIVV